MNDKASTTLEIKLIKSVTFLPYIIQVIDRVGSVQRIYKYKVNPL